MACGGRFSLLTTYMLASQMLELVKNMHHKGLIHRDIKPANFCMGQKGTLHENTVYLIDFGLSQ